MHDLREIVNAILYVCRTGIAWEYLPHDLPPYRTVYDYDAKWEADGTTEALHDLLRDRVRVARGRAATPTAAIIDSQSVKTSCNVDESSQGIEAGKKIKGRKRHIAADVLGLLLVVIVTAAWARGSGSSRVCTPGRVQDMGGWRLQQHGHPPRSPARRPGRSRQTPRHQGIPRATPSMGGGAQIRRATRHAAHPI